MVYRAVKNNKIVHICETNSEEDVIKSMVYEGITDYDTIEAVPNNYFQGKIGNDIREFDNKFEFLPLSQRKDYVTIPEGMKIEGEQFVPMTIKEKIDAGLIELSDREKYDEDTEQIRQKTPYELAEDNLMSLSELKEYHKNLISKSWENEFINGKFLSETLGIEVDCRRDGIRNDAQNVDGMIQDYDNLANNEKYYTGYSESTDFPLTLEQLQNLKLEMIRNVKGLYMKKRLKHYQIDNASLETVRNITW